MDLSNEGELKTYLKEKKIYPSEDVAVTYFSGGVSGVVALVSDGKSEMIIKQALKKLKVREDWFSSPSRMVIEKAANEVYYKYAPQNTPKVYFFDEENYIYGREAAPLSCKMWKTDLLEGRLNFQVARKVIHTLLCVHEECTKNPQELQPFLNKEFFIQLRISPYIEFTVNKHPAFASKAERITSLLCNSTQTLVHGDFSPKNILVDGDQVYILDFETAHAGHPAFDLAFFANHFLLKAVHNQALAPSYLNMLLFMMKFYLDHVSFTDRYELEKTTVELLSILLLARVDGKSTVEYMTDEKEKQFVRDISYAMLEKNIDTFQETVHFMNNKIGDMI